jgi:predicted DNA-binding transcriptional regulator AlpA
MSKPIIDDFKKCDSVPELCNRVGISQTTYYKNRAAGHGPREMRMPGSSIVRISPEARREWYAYLEQLAATEEVEQDRKQRIAKTSQAGRTGAASPAHHCRRRER